MLRIGDWCVNPGSGQISRADETVRLEERSMRLLLCLAERAGDVVSIDDLLDQVWSGVAVSPDSVYQAVASLRRSLGDDPRQPTYIATAPRLGYRLVAAVDPCTNRDHRQIQVPAPESGLPYPITTAPARINPKYAAITTMVLLVCGIATGVFLVHGRSMHPVAVPGVVPQPQESIACCLFST